MYGIIDGSTTSFNTDCQDALSTVVGSAFGIFKYKNIADPRNTVKMNLSINNFTTGTNNVYAFCDFTHLYAQFTMLTDTTNYAQYIQIASRSGSFPSK